MMFGSQETIHATAYSYLNESLGLEDFEAFFSKWAKENTFYLVSGSNLEKITAQRLEQLNHSHTSQRDLYQRSHVSRLL